MKVLIINVCLRPYRSDFIYFPIGLAYIATAIARAGFDFEILDLDVNRMSSSEFEGYVKYKHFDVVAMGCIVTGYKHVKRISEVIRKHKKDAVIIAGNSVATSIPEILLTKTKVDIGVIGEGDITIVELLKAIESESSLDNVRGIAFKRDNKIVITPEREIISNLDDLPTIDYTLFDMDVYLEKFKYGAAEPYPMPFEQLKFFPLNTARGCPYKCTFCYHVFRGKKYRTRSVESITKEMCYLRDRYGVNYIGFSDELSMYSREQASSFADHFSEVGIFWTADCRAGLFKDTDIELVNRLKKSGCIAIGYSLESANEEILQAMNKKISVDDFVIQTRVLHKAGINVSTGVVIGYPQETEETIQETFDCCYDCNIYPSVGYLLPQPGTPMYEYAIKSGRLKDEEEYLLKMGDRQDFHINLTNMEQGRIEELTKYHLRRIADKLQLGLDNDHLIKTGHYKQEEDK